MRMEVVQKELQRWGEVMITTSAGRKFELHLGDTEFDTEARLIRLQAPSSTYIIDGDSVEIMETHLGHAD